MIAGNENAIMPRNDKPGEISYRNPPMNVSKATLRLMAIAAYIPWAAGMCRGSSFSKI